MDEFSSGEESGSEFDGYITDEEVEDEEDRRDDAPNRFFQNESLHTHSATALCQSKSSSAFLSPDETLTLLMQGCTGPSTCNHPRHCSS